jgi:splicing factor 3B subunit 3
MIFVCSATHKTKSMFFFLAQTEQGDIFKITLETDEDMVSRPRVEQNVKRKRKQPFVVV